jgi:hypothetical protein
MSCYQLAHPRPEACLTSSRTSKYLGGTLVDETVWTLAEHQRRIANPDLYRPSECARCGSSKLHVHDRFERCAVGMGVAVVLALRFICANDRCRATWRVLPAFLARHLWHAWNAVESAVEPMLTRAQEVKQPCLPQAEASTVSHQADVSARSSEKPVRAKRPSRRTIQRWLSRLRSSPKQLVVMFSQSYNRVLCDIAVVIGGGDRADLVRNYMQALKLHAGQGLAAVAALVHRLERGVRLM